MQNYYACNLEHPYPYYKKQRSESMPEREGDFGAWEAELAAEGELIVVRQSLILAQQLQTHIQTLPRDYQYEAWLEALHLLSDEKI